MVEHRHSQFENVSPGFGDRPGDFCARWNILWKITVVHSMYLHVTLLLKGVAAFDFLATVALCICTEATAFVA